MVARGGEGIGHADVNGAAVVVNLVGLAVHEAGGALDDGAADKADALMAQADAEHRELWSEVADDVVAHAAFPGGARAGGDDNVRGVKGFDLVERHLVVAEHLHGTRGIDFAQLLHQVVGEGIVIVDQHEHCP